MLKATTQAQGATAISPPPHQPASATNTTDARRKSLIVITPSQILCGSFNNNNYLGNSNSTGTTTPLHKDDKTNGLEMKNTDTTELPPFSFLKKPIEERKIFNRDLKLNITSGIGGNKSRSRSATPRQLQSGVVLCLLNDIVADDYDEKIRCPQMSSHYIYGSKPVTNRSESFGKDLEDEQEALANADENKEYTPAEFDLSQPTRRNSTPTQTNRVDNEIKLLRDFTRDNCICEVKQDHVSPVCSPPRTNLEMSQNNGVTSTRLKNQASFPKPSKKASHQMLNQVYQMKKPLMTPAALRPEPLQELHPQQSPKQSLISAHSNSSSQSQDSASAKSSSTTLARNTMPPRKQLLQSPSLPPVNLNPTTSVYTIFTTDLQFLNISSEPTHQHWQLNNTADACMSCLRPFHSPLVTMIYDVPRRHHCRFCGLIFCKLCLNITDGSSTPPSTPTSSTSRSVSMSSTPTFVIADTQSNRFTTLAPIIDKNANFVIPVTTPGENLDSLAYHAKTCNKCTILYNTLYTEINKPANIASLVHKDDSTSSNTDCRVVVVENTYKNDLKRVDYETTTVSLDFKQLSIRSPKRQQAKDRNGVAVEQDGLSDRRMSVVGDIPNDWVWSSF